MFSPLPAQCWWLERVPWWEPPLLLHPRREAVLVGSGEETDKVLAGLQVAPHHLTLTRQGDPGDWRSVRWSLLPHHPHTFLNTARLQAGVAVPLTAGDIIGVGCPDRSSSRDGRNFTFVYKLNPPEARAETDLTSLSDLLQLSKSLPGR